MIKQLFTLFLFNFFLPSSFRLVIFLNFIGIKISGFFQSVSITTNLSRDRDPHYL